MKQQYTARWAQPGHPSIGNVSFDARSEYEAKQRANKIARELNLIHTPRTITNSKGELIEALNDGVSNT